MSQNGWTRETDHFQMSKSTKHTHKIVPKRMEFKRRGGDKAENIENTHLASILKGIPTACKLAAMTTLAVSLARDRLVSQWVNFSSAKRSPSRAAWLTPTTESGASVCPATMPSLFECVSPWRTMVRWKNLTGRRVLTALAVLASVLPPYFTSIGTEIRRIKTSARALVNSTLD